MNSDDREKLYEMIEDIGAAVLLTDSGTDLRSRPMENYIVTAASYGF
jgi:hypothetical protein